MIKAIEAAKKISNNPNETAYDILHEINMHKAFAEIYQLNLPHFDTNIIVCFIIYAFDPDSPKIDIRKDRSENKNSILESLGGDAKSELFSEILNNNNESFNNSVLNYLESITTWHWPTIFSLLDYHSNMLRFANQKTEAEKSIDKMNKEGEVKTLIQEYDVDVIAGVNKKKGELLDLAINARKKADELLYQLKKDFSPTDNATQSDFGFAYTDTAKEKVDIYSWKAWIKQINKRKKITTPHS